MTPGAAALVVAAATAAAVLGVSRRRSSLTIAAIATGGAATATVAAGTVGDPGDAATFVVVAALEAALSLDAVVAALALVAYFAIPSGAASRVVAWAIGTTILLRIAAVPFGAAALERADWLVYPLAALLAASTFALVRTGPPDVEHRLPGRNRVLAIAGRIAPVTNRYDRDRLRVPTATGHAWTPLAVAAICLVGVSAVLALDGFAAGTAITDDTMMVAAATILACSILGALHGLANDHLRGVLHAKAALSVLLLFAAVRLVATGGNGDGLGPAAATVVIALIIAFLAGAGLGPATTPKLFRPNR
ncbi:MAG TPA: hypothetical protein VFV35_01930 [Acidimicrobiales bacterium]|nr:hypothetical protein [Acidimicrobiales bacterium]